MRLLLAIGRWLGVGAIVAVAVSWACAAFAGQRPVSSPPQFAVNASGRGPRDWRTTSQSGFGCSIMHSSWGYAAVTFSGPPDGIAHTDPASTLSADEPWMWPTGVLLGGKERVSRMRAVSVAAGFPMPCLRGGWLADLSVAGSPTMTSHGAIVLAASPQLKPPSGDWRQTVILPLRPLWWNLLLDSAIWGASAWLLSRGPSRALRSIRRRRGGCVRCAHPLAGASTCPECGERVRSGPA